MSVTPCSCLSHCVWVGSGTGRKESVGGSAQCLFGGHSVGYGPVPTYSDLHDGAG